MATYNSANGIFQPSNKTLFDGVTNFSGIHSDLGVQVARGMVPGVQGLSISGFQTAVSGTFIPLWDFGIHQPKRQSAFQLQIITR